MGHPEIDPADQRAPWWTGALARRLAEQGVPPTAEAPAPPVAEAPRAGVQVALAPPLQAPPPAPPWPGSAPWPSPPRPPGRRSGVFRTVGVIALALILGAGSWLVIDRFARPPHAAAAPTPSYPTAWDPRVQPLVDFVQNTRGLTFDHPVFVDFLTPAQYSATVRIPAPTATDRVDAQRQAAEDRAVGLLSGTVDLAASDNQMVDQGTLAYYSYRSKRIDVRGTGLTAGLRVTLVHELTHALQDQHFDITRIDRMPSSGEKAAFQTLFEGDAVRIQKAYERSLSPADSQAFDAEQQAQDSQATVGLASVPPALVTLFGAPYELGPELLSVLTGRNGNQSVDDAFRNPPIDEAQVFDPWVYLANQQPDKVSDPALTAGEKRFDSGDYGALSWFVTLSQRVDPRVAIIASDAWAGDAYVAFQRNQQVCLRDDIDARSSAAGDAMAAAFTQWSNAMPSPSPRVTRRGTGVEVTACDPGPAANLKPVATAAQAMVLPVSRTEFILATLHQGLTTAQARCAGNAVVQGYSVADLADPTGAPFLGTAGRVKLLRTIAPCRTAP